MKKILAFIAVIAIGLSFSTNAHAIISVLADYTYTGSAGNYLLDFTLTNNIPSSYNQYVYFFGVDLADDSAQGSPAGWWDYVGIWNNYSTGGPQAGSHIDYPSTWITYLNGSDAVGSGSSLSGFTVHTTSIPSVINYYAFAIDDPIGSGPYYGDDAFFKGSNPGFEGVARNNNAIPEPATMSLLGLGILGLAGFRRKK